MDALATRYADPGWILDGYIKTGQLCAFLGEFFRLRQDAQNWDFFLHKVFGESWNDFQRSIATAARQQESDAKFNLETTINDAKTIAIGIKPPDHQEGGAA